MEQRPGSGDRAWRVERVRGRAGGLHARDVPAGTRLVRVHQVLAPAAVLGSTQPEHLLDAGALAAGGWERARRRSGGGLVTLAPGAQAWVDVVVPAGDPLWDDDVCHASWWLGDAWAAAVAAARPGAAPSVHRGPVSDRDSGRVACFASVGPGELVLDGRKVLGISQRRTRHWARFQCVAYHSWDGARVAGLLSPSAATARVVDALVGRAGAVLPAGWDPVEHLLPHLPA